MGLSQGSEVVLEFRKLGEVESGTLGWYLTVSAQHLNGDALCVGVLTEDGVRGFDVDVETLAWRSLELSHSEEWRWFDCGHGWSVVVLPVELWNVWNVYNR